VQVTDPLGHATQYTYNALGDLLQLDSPDTGNTTYTYDDAGNRWTQSDARGVVAEFTYDALNRLTDITYPSDPTLNVTYTYDQGPNGIGRMTDMADASGSTAWTYDAQGRVTSKTQTVATAVLTVQYQYDAGGRLSGVIYPDGTVLGYGYDPAGRLATALAAPGGGTGQSVIDGVDYLPFGPVSRLNFAVFPDQDRTYDLDYRPQALSGPLARTYGTDPAGNITGITQGADAWNFEYDDLYRLETVTDPKGAIVESFAYDSNGNRTSHDGEIYQTDLTSNRLAQRGAIAYQYDAMGNTTGTIGDAAGDVSLFYGAHQRLLDSTRDQWQGSYRYNGRGERVRKDWFFGRGVSQVRVFLYDESGRLLGEYAEDGTPVAQYLWLGNMPIGVIQSGQVYAIHTDHLTTPRVVINSQGTTVWRWESLAQPFGENLPDTDPDGNGATFTMNLRFPGQYFDQETRLHYNYFRDYDPGVGRYVESDPIGLQGGENTYVYVFSKPLDFGDLFGLISTVEKCLTDPRAAAACYEAGIIPKPAPRPAFPPVPIPNEPCDDDDSERCKRVKEMCIETCSESSLPSGDYGFRFWNCVNRCMEDNGCK